MMSQLHFISYIIVAGSFWISKGGRFQIIPLNLFQHVRASASQSTSTTSTGTTRQSPRYQSAPELVAWPRGVRAWATEQDTPPPHHLSPKTLATVCCLISSLISWEMWGTWSRWVESILLSQCRECFSIGLVMEHLPSQLWFKLYERKWSRNHESHQAFRSEFLFTFLHFVVCIHRVLWSPCCWATFASRWSLNSLDTRCRYCKLTNISI